MQVHNKGVNPHSVQFLPRFAAANPNTPDAPKPPAPVHVPVIDEVQVKTDTFRQELTHLLSEDKKRLYPVFDWANPDSIIRQVQQFLSRQKKAGTQPTPFLIGLAGGTNSGKTTILHMMREKIHSVSGHLFKWKPETHGPEVETLELDNYYKNFSKFRKEAGDIRFFKETNLDEPNALALEQAQKTLMKLKNGIADRAPLYDFTNSERHDGVSLKTPAPFVIFEGLFALVPESLRKLADLKIFVNADTKTRTERFWARAPQRNIKQDEGGNALLNKAMTMHNVHVQPTMTKADLVLNGALPKAEINQALEPLMNLFVKTLHPPKIKAPDADQEISDSGLARLFRIVRQRIVG